MVIPPRIKIQLESSSQIDPQDIIVQMTVIAGTKNPYHINFPKTAQDGSSSISQDEFAGQFADHYATGLMDYNGSVPTASQFVTITLFDPGQFSQSLELLQHWPLLPYESTKWSSRAEIIGYLLSCRNAQFMAPPLTVKIEEGVPIRYIVAVRAA